MLNYPGLDGMFQALADPTRRDMVDALAKKPTPVAVLARRYDISLSAVSQHLKILIDSGLVRSDKLGRVRICSLRAAALMTIENWVSGRRRLIETRLDHLEAYLAVEKRRPQ